MFPRGFSLSRVLRFYESFQVIEARCPEHAVLLDPGIDRTQGFRIQFVNAMPPFAMFPNQVGPSQQSQVLRNCRPRNRKGAGNLSRRLTAPAKQVQHRSAGGVGQGLECNFPAWCRRRMCNQSITHNAYTVT